MNNDWNVFIENICQDIGNKSMGYKSEDYPVSLDTFHRVITLPVFYDLEKEQLEQVVEVIAEAVEHQLLTNYFKT